MEDNYKFKFEQDSKKLDSKWTGIIKEAVGEEEPTPEDIEGINNIKKTLSMYRNKFVQVNMFADRPYYRLEYKGKLKMMGNSLEFWGFKNQMLSLSFRTMKNFQQTDDRYSFDYTIGSKVYFSVEILFSI